jgi:hypothetical protein
MRSATLTSRAAAATVALGLGVALASAATPVASADTGDSPSSANARPTGSSARTKQASAAQKASAAAANKPATAQTVTDTRSAPTKLTPTTSMRVARSPRTSASLAVPRRSPSTNTPESPADWIAAVVARRDMDVVADIQEAFRRANLAVTALLTPVKALIDELATAGRDDPIPPGACEDGDCNPTSEIPLPWIRNEITVLNLTGKQVTMSDLYKRKPLAYGPQKGYVLDNARQTEMAFYQNSSSWDDDWQYEGTVTWSDGSSTVSVDIDAGGSTASSSSDGMQVVVFDTPEPVTGTSMISERQTIVLLPKAGTTITIEPTDPVGQALAAMALCKVSGSCGQQVVDEQIRLSAPKLVGNTLFNDGTVTSTNTYRVSQEVSKSSGVEENLKIVAGLSFNFALGPFAFQAEVNGLIQQKYAHSWTDGITTESRVDMNVPPGSYGQISVQYPEYHDYVNMTLTNAGVTINIPNVDYVSLAPSGSIDEDGNPIAVTYTTQDWAIGTGPHPYPDSDSTPTPPPSPNPVEAITTPDIPSPAAAPGPLTKSLAQVVGDFVQDESRAIRALPAIIFTGRAVVSETFRITNLTTIAQTLTSITGDYEEDNSPEKGFVLQPFQAIDIEVDYNLFGDQETYVTWSGGGFDTKAELKVFNGGSDPRVTCQNTGCMSGGWTGYEADMYVIYPYSPTVLDVTTNANLASAAVDIACAPGNGGSVQGSCGVNATGQTEYNVPVSGPVQQQINRGTQTNSYYYTVTTYKSETASWSAGGGVKLKEKAGVLVAQQIEIESSVLYTGSTQVKDSESSTVAQDLLPGYGGAIYIGDPYLRTWGDYIVNLPNLTLVVKDQWIEAASGLGAQGPVASVTDYPLD